MFKYYADDSALKKMHEGKRSPVFLFGGILISRQDEVELSNLIKEVKREYTGEDMPLKYNMKGIREVYERFGRIPEYERLIHDSATWRKRIIQKSLKFDYKIFISCIENFQAKKKEQKTIKENLSSFLFSNALMRVGIFASENQNHMEHIQVILDWPESNLSKPFDKEYYYAYNRGTNSEGQEYFCGPLNRLGFDQTLYYAKCNHSNLLQLTDIILGSTRDWIETELQKREYSIGMELSRLFLPKFYGYPRKILGYGINVSSGNKELKEQLNGIINKNVA
ncbi:MAG: DUF3800 domain-containing protein [Chlorobi bacterium]|nr:DUF3800 domain-containing protein [Chlorobiota bacterium]